MKLCLRNTDHGLIPLYDSEPEIWKDIEGFKGLYQVSNMGNVKSLRKGIIMSPGSNGKYLFVYLSKKAVVKRFYIHILVAKYFVPNPENKPEVNHKFCDKMDNRACVLEWNTRKENMEHAKLNNRFYASEYQIQQTIKANSGENNWLSKFKESDIRDIRALKLQGLTNRIIAGKYNVNRETIGYIVRGKTWKHVK